MLTQSRPARTGDAARAYFEAFNGLIRQQREAFSVTGRSQRPPLDPLNAMLSFVDSVRTHDMAGVLESVGLDPAVGFLHVDRPGRLSLALDLLLLMLGYGTATPDRPSHDAARR